jgi:hypothetical protein
VIAKRQLGLALVRLFVAYAALCAVFALAGANIVKPLAPVFGRELEWLCPEIRVEKLATRGSDVTVNLKGVSGNAHGQYRVTTDASYCFIYPIVVLSLLAGWPFGHWRPRLIALGVAAGLLALLVSIDFPLEFAANVTRFFDKKAPFGYFFFNNGGRQFLALLIVAAALVAGTWGRRLPVPEQVRARAKSRRRGGRSRRFARNNLS